MGKGRAPCCDKNKVKRGPWSPQEDLKLVTFIQKHGHHNWRSLPKQAGLLRCGKSCRLRWINYLRPDVKRGNFTKEEEDTIIKLHETLGNKWSRIASELPGRTDNEIKNVWHTHLKKKLLKNTNSDDRSKQGSCITSSSSSPSSSSSSSSSTLIPQRTTTDNIINEQNMEDLYKESSSPNSFQCSAYQSSSTPICRLQDDDDRLELGAGAGEGSPSSLNQGTAGPEDNNDDNCSNNKVLNEIVDKPTDSNSASISGLLEIPLMEADDDFWNMLDDDNIGGGVSNDNNHHQVHSDGGTMKNWIREIEKDLGLLEPAQASSSSSSDLTIGLSDLDIDIWLNDGSSGF